LMGVATRKRVGIAGEIIAYGRCPVYQLPAFLDLSDSFIVSFS